MKFNTIALPLITIFGMNSFAIASDKNVNSKDNGNFYAGVDVGFYNQTELENINSSIKVSSDLLDFGYNLAGGYQFNTHDVVKLGLEAEYRKIGKVTLQCILVQLEDAGLRT